MADGPRKKTWSKRVWRRIKYSRFYPLNSFRRDAYSLEGEDLILRRAFGKHLRDGFYVDVGAYHPKAASNTCLFYRWGWRGINIDAMPGSMRRFRAMRPRDINLEVGVGPNPGEMPYWEFGDQALNTFSGERKDALAVAGKQPTATHVVPVRPLADILSEHVPEGSAIHFLNVDVEGFDVEVLRSNDWTRFRPWYVLLETLDWKLTSPEPTEAVQTMFDSGYELFARTVNTTVFRSSD